jgi:serine/threonine protein kinase
MEKLEPLVLGSEWARGAFGSVHVAPAPSGRVAVKSVPDPVGHANRELETCMRLASDNNPGIVRFLGYWTEDAVLFLVMEFFQETLGGVLARLAEINMRMKTDRMTTLVGQLAGALDYLEQIGLMHRDLKPDNLLVNVATSRLVVCDFGSAKFCSCGQSVTYVCTRNYRAPELILGRDTYSTKVDVWAFGCILAEFAYGRPLFSGDTQVDILAGIIRIRGMVTVDDIAHMPTQNNETSEVAPVCVEPKLTWSKIFTRRVGARRVNTSYGEVYERTLDACLQWNPCTRISAHELANNEEWA